MKGELFKCFPLSRGLAIEYETGGKAFSVPYLTSELGHQGLEG